MWDNPDNDEEFLRALEESRRLYEEVEIPRLSQQTNAPSPLIISEDDALPGPSTSTLSARDTFKKPLPSVSHGDNEDQEEEFYDGPEAEGFSFKNGKIWVYPTSDNFPIRFYQRTIVETALFHNTLVSLPTGLGKTFIAAVVMYNFYMWYPKGKIIFMAPTKPLVAQQIENCINIMGIPESHTAEMTGAMHSKLRAGIWKEKRVFFLTPQVVQNDLTASICPANAVKCVVIDEAHRAQGDHAYAQVIRILNSYEARFRVLALSATPGSDLEAVQKVVSNLMVSHLELRNEDSPDIVQYRHERNLELMVVDVGPTINRIRVKLVGIAADYARRLQEQKLLFGNMSSIPRYTVLREWENFRREKCQNMNSAAQNRVNTDFAIVHTLVHGLELLQTYGLRLLLNHLQSALNKGDLASNRLSVNDDLKALMEEIESVLNPIEIDGEVEGQKKKRYIYGHPKLDRLQEVVITHFENFEKKGETTRAIVFCEYREGVIEICDMLKNFEPLIKPVVFMGQSTGKGGKGISQKQQIEIMEKFRRGFYNTLISTSVGEEGLDIGEVDLIICFDAKNSPIRQVQRMGRTGRKRQGRIIMLVTRGKEEQKYNQGLFKKKSVSAVLLKRENLANFLLDESPLMLPPGVQPKYTERKVEPPANKPKSNQQDLRKMFARRPTAGGSGSIKPGGRSSLGKSSYLSEKEFEELKSMWDIQQCCKFNKIPDRVEFWTRSPDEIQGPDLTPTNIDPSTYLEFLRYPQRTHIVGNSSDSKLLSELLVWAEDRREACQGTMFAGISSQITSTQIWPTKQKKRGRPPANDLGTTNPPNKRGRPVKTATIDSHFQHEPKDDGFGQALKPKSKFIEDEEDAAEAPLPKALQLQASTSSFLPPTTTQPIQKLKSPNTNLYFPAASDAFVVASDSDVEELDCSASSGYADLSSQISKQELLRDLWKALRNQKYIEENECNICDTLFPCKSLNKLVLGKKVKKVDTPWENVTKSLEEALVQIPSISEEQLAKHHKFIFKSQMIPKLEIAAYDEITDGLLCGGFGDLSQQRTVSPPLKNSTTLLHQYNPTNHEFLKKTKLEINFFAGKDNPVDSRVPAPEQKVSVGDLSIVKDEFEDVSFDFLGLSKLDDIFTSQKSNQAENLTEIDSTKMFGRQTPVWSEAMIHDIGQGPVCNVTTSETQNFQTPPKVSQSAPISPILCAQTVQKAHVGQKFRKRIVVSQVEDEKCDGDSSVLGDSIKEKINSDEKVTSSSQMSPSSQNNGILEVNFDIFDDSLFALPDEDTRSKYVVDEGLREAIVKKALEAKAKKAEITFTQELNKMCETSIEGLTQVLEMYDEREKTLDLTIQRADSASSPLKEDWSCSPVSKTIDELNSAKIEDIGEHVSTCLGASEEDLFADCDESLFNHIDSREKLDESPVKNDNDNRLLQLDKDKGFLKELPVQDSGKVEDPTLTQTLDRSTSPIFRPSQVMKRPSKLRLKKKIEAELPSARNCVDNSSDTPIKESPSGNDSKPKEVCSQIDFSMFGDEFNNSWLCSQEKKSFTLDVENDKGKQIGLVNSKNEEEMKCTEESISAINAKIRPQSCLPSEGSSSDNDLEVAFAKLDAERREKKKLFGSTSSTPKINKTKSMSHQQTIVQKPDRSFSFKRKLSPKDAQPSSSYIQNGWICAEPKEKDLSLTAFCDETLLEHIMDNEKTKESSKILNKDLSNQKKTSDFMDFGSSKPYKCFREENSDRKKLSLRKKTNTTDLISGKCVNKSALPLPKTAFTGEQNIVEILSSDEENIVQKPRKVKKCLNITSSSEEGWMQCEVDSPADSKQKDQNSRDSSLSSESSRHFGGKRVDEKGASSKGCTSKSGALDLSTFCDDSLLNDLVNEGEEKKHTSRFKNKEKYLSSDDDVFVRKSNNQAQKKKQKKKKRKKNSKRTNGFIMNEAEESSDGFHSSSDGESTSLDELDSSFINDSQPEASQSVVDIHHKYLEAVRSPARGAGRFKIPDRLPEVDLNVFSQFPDASELDQSYANDSFCVDNEPTQYEPEMSLLELAEAKLKAQRKEKRRRRKRNFDSCSSESDDLMKEVATKKKRRRIHILEETVVEDDNQGDKEPKGLSPTKIFNHESNLKTNLAVFDGARTSGLQDCNPNNELTKLLDDDDDIDFSCIPDVPEAEANDVKVTEPPRMSTTKFVKKVPFMLNDNFRKMKFPNAEEGPTNSSSLPQLQQKTSNSTVSCNAARMPSVTSTTDGNKNSLGSRLLTPKKAADSVSTTPTYIIASSKQIAQSPDVLRILRVSYHVVIIPHSVPDADFILSWRLGTSRIFASDLRDKKKLEDVVKKLKDSYLKPHLIVENDRLKLLATSGRQKKGNKSNVSAPVNPGSSTLSPWISPSGCANAALLRQAGVMLLFSQNSDETAGYLAKLAKRETNAGHGIPACAQNVSDEVENRLNFFTCLPGINYAFAFKLLSKFVTLSDFFLRCSSVTDIVTCLGLDIDTSRKIHKIICEVYVNP